MTSTQYSIAAAARITGKSRATISRHMKSSKLSYELDNDGNKVLDASELIRVYGQDCDFDREAKKGRTSETSRSDSQTGQDVAALKEMQDRLIRQYVAQIDHLKEALDKAQDGQNRVTLLLERQTSDGSTWQASLDAMSEKIASQTETQIKELREGHNREIAQLKRALHSERNKSFWKRLFR